MEITHNLKKCMADMFPNISGVDRSSLKEDRKAIFQAYDWLPFPQLSCAALDNVHQKCSFLKQNIGLQKINSLSFRPQYRFRGWDVAQQ